jgi:hypothetical protein
MAMLASDVYPAGVPCWIDIAAAEPDRAAAFYGRLFGWEAEPIPAGSYRIARLDGRTVAGIRPAAGAGPVWRTYVCVDDVEASLGRAASAGGRVVDGPANLDGIAAAALLADPAGAVLGVWQPDGLRGAGLVNAPATWNFSNLATPDPDAATAFYGEVFGWVARSVDLGGEGTGTSEGTGTTMWCLPGYGETQDAKDPGFLRRHAEGGTPDGFTDAFGWMEAAAPGASASWDVTFAVDDVDAVVERARGLGGAVRVAAFDAGPARVAALADPAGAGFTVSAYQP